MDKIKVLVVGCGNMGISHARAYQEIDGYEINGLVSRGDSKIRLNEDLVGSYPIYDNFEIALAESKPDAVCISTYPETHAEYAIKSLNAGAHVFLEKPLATTVEEAQEVVDLALKLNLKLVIGYILRVHPAWKTFITEARKLGKPLVMRMNLNQQSFGKNWGTHKNLMKSMSPIVDCGVHYVDVMCQMTNAKPIRVNGIGARMTNEIDVEMYNYGHLQVMFDDGSVGWYEAGWGPMMSETAYFVKDVIGPKGSVSIVDTPKGEGSVDIEGHTKTGSLRVHGSELDAKGNFKASDRIINTSDEPDHDGLCKLEQEYFKNAIEKNLDLSDHLNDAVSSLQIVLAADESFKTGKTVEL